jgi:epoxyqueuosine reductase
MKEAQATQMVTRQTGKELLLRLREHSCKGRIVSVEHVRDLQEEIEGRYERGLLDKEFYQERLAYFDFHIPPKDLPEAKSLLVVAVPRPQSQAVFTWSGESKALTIPPTYVANERTRRRIRDVLAEILAPRGYRLTPTALPLKLLATHSGLGVYGKNNICYVPGMGSFLQLVAFYSDLPCWKDRWQEAQMMKYCNNCCACRQVCPAGAISPDRFILHAERCIVFHNERKGDIPFPAWIEPSWHNCLVGCMHCQRVCPQNRKFLQRFGEKEEFSEEETRLLLGEIARDRLLAATVTKLKDLDLYDDIDILQRNLGIFFKK